MEDKKNKDKKDKEPTQEELSRFVEREIIYCQSSLVDDLLKTGYYNFEDIENAYAFNIDEAIYQLNQEIKADKKGKELKAYLKENDIKSLYDLTKEEFSDLADALDISLCVDDYEEPQEIFEWWIVTDWLLEKLGEEGEAILRTEHGDYWGRCTTGQAILLDGVIRRIYNKCDLHR